jgi:hypothetical protein
MKELTELWVKAFRQENHRDLWVFRVDLAIPEAPTDIDCVRLLIRLLLK